MNTASVYLCSSWLSGDISLLDYQKLVNALNANMTPKLSLNATLSCISFLIFVFLKFSCSRWYGRMCSPYDSAACTPSTKSPNSNASALENTATARPAPNPVLLQLVSWSF